MDLSSPEIWQVLGEALIIALGGGALYKARQKGPSEIAEAVQGAMQPTLDKIDGHVGDLSAKVTDLDVRMADLEQTTSARLDAAEADIRDHRTKLGRVSKLELKIERLAGRVEGQSGHRVELDSGDDHEPVQPSRDG